MGLYLLPSVETQTSTYFTIWSTPQALRTGSLHSPLWSSCKGTTLCRVEVGITLQCQLRLPLALGELRAVACCACDRVCLAMVHKVLFRLLVLLLFILSLLTTRLIADLRAASHPDACLLICVRCMRVCHKLLAPNCIYHAINKRVGETSGKGCAAGLAFNLH
jgi:hypothetical protein